MLIYQDLPQKIAVYYGNKLTLPSYSEEMKRALGLISGFSKNLTLINKPKLKITAIE